MIPPDRKHPLIHNLTRRIPPILVAHFIVTLRELPPVPLGTGLIGIDLQHLELGPYQIGVLLLELATPPPPPGHASPQQFRVVTPTDEIFWLLFLAAVEDEQVAEGHLPQEIPVD